MSPLHSDRGNAARRPKLLDNFALLRTSKPDEVREALAWVYAEPILRLGRDTKALNAAMNECHFPNVRLSFGTYGGDVSLDFPPVDWFVQLVPLRGTATISSRGQTVALPAAAGATLSPDSGYRANYDSDYEALVLKFDAKALTNKLTALTGATLNEPLRMALQSDATPRARVLRQYVKSLATLLSEAVPPLPNWWVAQTEQLLMVMFLCGHRHNYSHLMEREAPDSAPWQVRRAEDYIEANWREAITLEELATVTGVSAFSLFRTFRKTRGYSPLDFASRLRAKQAGRS